MRKQARPMHNDPQDTLVSNDDNDLEDVSVSSNNNDDPEDASVSSDDNDLISNNDDDEDGNDNDLEDISVNSNNDDDFEDSNDGLQNDFENVLIDDNLFTQRIADGPAFFNPLNGEYGPYFANFTEQMLFLWITKHMISK